MKDYQHFTRRRFIKNSLLATGGMFIAPLFISCNNDWIDDGSTPQGLQNNGFNLGVASFDPTESSIIIWTRYTKETEAEITWEISLKADFSEVLRREKVYASSINDFTVSIDVQNIPSNSKFYYRFYNNETKETSITGETITLPSKTDNVQEAKMAVVSCSNFASGLFNVYNAVAKSEADVVLHLGDYIYEHAPGQYGTNSYTNQLNRAHKPAKEIITLSDYRERYRQYRSDKDLQLLHQKKPFICVWDDHEIADDAYKSGALNHQPQEGSFEARKMAAFQAYCEYIPLKTGKDFKIYRSFEFGNILSLYMLDTRLIARDKQLDYSDYIADSLFDMSFDFDKFNNDLTNPDRKMIGDEQMAWLRSEINSTSTAWKVIGQQVLMTKMMLPFECMILLSKIMKIVKDGMSYKNDPASAEMVETLQNKISELSEIKKRSEQNYSINTHEKQRLASKLPFNLDAWDGYFAEREKLYSVLSGKKVIVLAGDTHSAWCGKLTDEQGNFIGTELATSSVTSQGDFDYLGLDSQILHTLSAFFPLLVDDLKYANLSHKGYLYVKFTPASVQPQWRFVDNIISETYTVFTENSIVIQ